MAKVKDKETEAPAQVPVTTAAQQVPAVMDPTDYGADAGVGMEGVDRDEKRIPFARILQSNSPQIDPSRGTPLSGAMAGMIFNTATEEFWPADGTTTFVAAFRSKDFTEWTPQDLGGGIVGRRTWDDPEVMALREEQGRFGKLKTAGNTEIVQTFYLYGTLYTPSGPRDVAFAFTSTQIKKYQAVIDRIDSTKFNTNGRIVQPPIFAFHWKITSRPEKNKKGNWMGIKIEPAGETVLKSLLRTDDPKYLHGREFHDLMASGKAKADLSGLDPNDNGDDVGNLDEVA